MTARLPFITGNHHDTAAGKSNLARVHVSAMKFRRHEHPLPDGAVQDGFAGRVRLAID